MQEIAIVYFIVAWLACWDVDLLSIMFRGPVLIEIIIKFVVVTTCLAMVLVHLFRRNWLLRS